ncbi:hypothetical protein AQUCO_09500006v1 [Aquilegia coerulea]|nr:hypothetical protein AQUCO_09500006v1 [Aquilegia coerulea]
MKKKKMGRRNRAAVVVLGDFGRSPRMQYHALSLARQANLEVDVVAYGGSDPHAAVLENRSIHIHEMKQWLRALRHLPKLFSPLILLLKPLFQIFMLMWFLCIKIPAPDVFIVQNPPSIPTLLAVQWASWFRRAAFVVDWHNFGYTLLGLSLGRSSWFVRIYHWFEKHFGRMADGALCVTRAMQHELAEKWGITATVLYDHPPEFFHPASLEEKYKLFCRLKKNIIYPYGIRDCVSMGTMGTSTSDSNDTLFTTQVGTEISLKMNRPAIMRLRLKHVAFRTMWLPAEDYSLLLGSADLGVCLHTSSSGLDLPMKVVDMFGCGLPVCAVSYPCIEELVKVEKNGLLFSSSSELAVELLMLFKGFPGECNLLKLLREGALETGSSSR